MATCFGYLSSQRIKQDATKKHCYHIATSFGSLQMHGMPQSVSIQTAKNSELPLSLSPEHVYFAIQSRHDNN
jgi:hypothetical protein